MSESDLKLGQCQRLLSDGATQLFPPSDSQAYEFGPSAWPRLTGRRREDDDPVEQLFGAAPG